MASDSPHYDSSWELIVTLEEPIQASDQSVSTFRAKRWDTTPEGDYHFADVNLSNVKAIRTPSENVRAIAHEQPTDSVREGGCSCGPDQACQRCGGN